jgi:hypothetical protein
VYDVWTYDKDIAFLVSVSPLPQYDEWFRRYLMLERKVPGYTGRVDVKVTRLTFWNKWDIDRLSIMILILTFYC